jgi:hypothetical protein
VYQTTFKKGASVTDPLDILNSQSGATKYQPKLKTEIFHAHSQPFAHISWYIIQEE